MPAGAAAAEQDPEGWLRLLSEAIQKALGAAGYPALEGVGIGAFGPAMVTLDEALRPTGAASLFAYDVRHEPWRRRLLDGGMSEERLGPDHVLPKLMRIAEAEPDRFASTAWAVDATGFLVAALTGVAVMDPITRLDHVLDGPPPRPVPDVAPADSVAGRVTAEAARRFGLPSGTPVAVGSYDSYVDLFGAGVARDGDAGMLLGSTAVICRVGEPAAELGALRATPHIGKGRMVGGWTSSAGSLLDWAKSVTSDGDGHAPAGPGEAGLIMLPYLAGERAPVWDARARGALIGLTLSTTSEGIRRAALEAVALSVMDIAGRIEAVCGPTPCYRVAGGGAAIPGLLRSVADATGATLEVVVHPGEACGGAILAANAVGTPIARAVAGVIGPDPERSERYAKLMEIYRPLYGQLAEAMHRLGDLVAGREA